MRRFAKLIIPAAGVITFLLFIDTPLPLSTRLQIIGLVLLSAMIIYRSLALSINYLITRSAERLTPKQIIANMVSSSVFLAALVGSIATITFEWLIGVHLTAIDYVYNIGLFSVIAAGVTAIYSLRSFVQRWKSLLLMEEGLKQAVLKAEFESLKNQVNPHFLFNSLNILSALIPEDPAKSVQFVERLSKVFRYSLQHADQNTVELATELKVAESYLFINQMRFGDNFSYDFDLPDADRQKRVVTQGLLTLLENALKHNECSRERPLHVQVATEEQFLVITNNFQPKGRLGTDSTGIGLKNLQNRYAQLAADRPVTISQTDTAFTVKLPLL